MLQGHLKDGYGRLISAYTKLLVQKLNFHKKVSTPLKTTLLDDFTYSLVVGFTAMNLPSCLLVDWLLKLRLPYHQLRNETLLLLLFFYRILESPAP